MNSGQIKQLQDQAEKDAAELRLLLLTSLAATWDAPTGKWNVNGRTVSIDSIRLYLLRIESKMGRRIVNLIDALEQEKITLAAWQREFDRSIASSHILAAALAIGSIVGAIANPDVIDRIESEQTFADEFVTEIRKKKAGSFAAIKSRAKSYYRAATVTYSQTEQKVRDLIGIQTECIRVLRAVEDCPCCIFWANKGYILIAEQPPIGTLTGKKCCGIYDRCYLIYR